MSNDLLMTGAEHRATMRRTVSGIDDLLERLRNDPAFVAALAADPTAALEGFDLTADDLDTLADRLRPPGDVPEPVLHFADLFGTQAT